MPWGQACVGLALPGLGLSGGIEDLRRSPVLPAVPQCGGHDMGGLLRVNFPMTLSLSGFTVKGSLG